MIQFLTMECRKCIYNVGICTKVWCSRLDLKKISVVVEFIDDVVCFVEQRVEIAVGSTLTGQSIDHGLE